MSKDRPPSFQWYPRDYMAEMSRAGLSWDQQGRYRWALDCSWESESYGVACEDQWRRWMRYTERQWSAVRETFAPLFSVEGGEWVQKRLREVRSEQEANYRSAKSGADATNAKRWGITKGGSHPDKTAIADSSLRRRSTVTPASASASASASAKNLGRSLPGALPGTGPQVPSEPHVMTIPTNLANRDRPITAADLELWEATYPAVDVPQTLREIRAWALANPSRRKTWDGIPRFINNWLKKEQNGG